MPTTKLLPRGVNPDERDEVWQILARYLIPAGIPKDPEEPVQDTAFVGGYPDEFVDDGTDIGLMWYNDLSPEAEAEWDSLVKRARQRTETPSDAEMSPHIQVLKAYKNEPSPTQAQTVTALKAAIEMIRLLVKDD